MHVVDGHSAPSIEVSFRSPSRMKIQRPIEQEDVDARVAQEPQIATLRILLQIVANDLLAHAAHFGHSRA